ncbi:MAG: tetratricopeptide repeat protein [Desulfuromonadaceae bacterium]
MILLRLCRTILSRLLVLMILISSLIVPPAFCQETEDSQLFIAGFNAYQQKNYASSIEKMNEVLQKHPDTPLRDMALFWLSRSYFKVGNQQDAARYLSQFSKEYPDNPLKNTAEDELIALTARFEKGEKLAGGESPVKQPDIVAAQNVTAAQKELVAAVEAEEAKRAAGAVAQELQAAAKAEELKLAVSVADEEKQEQRRLADYRAELNRLAALKKDEESRQVPQNLAGASGGISKRVYREKAISEYKSIIDKYPTSAAAVTAAAKLRELGVATALPSKSVEASQLENTQVLRFEVAQFAAFEFNLLASQEVFTAGRQIEVPFEVVNRGNGVDSFYLESAFPADFNARFISAAAPGIALNRTPDLAQGETFKGLVTLAIPPSSIDGLRIAYPVKAASRLAAEASQTREVRIITSAPLLRAVLRTEKTRPLPGDKVLYRVAILNAGSEAAKDVTFRLNFPPQLEPVDYVAAGFRQEMKSALVLDGMQVKSGESREFTFAFQLKDDSLAGQELLTRAELINNSHKTTAAFVSNTAYVEPQRSILVRTGSERLVAFPGQTITVPFVVTNRGNIREKYKIVSAVSGSQETVVFHDINRDGIRQASEPVITEIGPLAPHEEAGVVVEIKTAKRAIDGSQETVKVSFISEGDATSAASGSTQLTYSRPVLSMAMSGRDGRLKPGDVTSFDLVITNQGSNLARIVELQSVWPEQLELMAADPATSAVSNGAIVWRFKELGAGEKRSIRISFRVKPGIGVGTAIQVKNILTYEDRLGNRY